MPIRQELYWENFARFAYIIQVDIDENELKLTIKIDLPIVSDAKFFQKIF